MATLLIALAVLMVTGGGIAFLGDRLGFIIGKRRHSIFRMRPRHTAIFTTVVAGALIAAITFLFLLLINRGFRDALLKGAALLKNNNQLHRQIKRLQLQAENAESSATAAQLQSSRAQDEVLKADQDLAAIQSQLLVAQQATVGAQKQLKNRQTQLEKVSLDLAQMQRELLQAQAQTLKLGMTNEVLTQRGQASLEDTVIYRNNQELGRTVVQATESQDTIKTELDRFLNHLSDQAQQSGAAVGKNGRAVILPAFEIVDATGSESGNGRRTVIQVGEDDSLNALAGQIHALSQGSVVVIASAFGNSFAKRQVVVALKPYINRLALQAGTVLGETTIPSTDTPNQIVALLQEFLVKTVRPVAIHAGVIPIADPQSNQLELGEVSLQDIYSLVQQIQDLHGAAIVTATAASDTYSGDHLQLHFSVRPTAASPTP